MIGKLVVDYEEVRLGDLLEFLTKNDIECCIDSDSIYVYNPKLDIQGTKLILSEKKKIQNYFFKELTSPPTKEPTNYVETWLLEKFNEEERIKREAEQQKTIRKILDDIENFRVLLQQELKTKK